MTISTVRVYGNEAAFCNLCFGKNYPEINFALEYRVCKHTLLFLCLGLIRVFEYIEIYSVNISLSDSGFK